MLNRPLHILAFCFLLSLAGCFTGIESTPKITDSDVKKEHISVSTEQLFLSDVKSLSPAQWQPGHRFRITDPKIMLVLSAAPSLDADSLKGRDMTFRSLESVKSVTGEDLAVLRFDIDGTELTYDTSLPYEELVLRKSFEIPFTVDLELVDTVAARLVGNTFYITTPLWYDVETEKSVAGLRHVPVVIDSVLPGNSVYPIKVVFTQEGTETQPRAVFMTIGAKRSSTRNFETLFAFHNPRDKYPLIDDDKWRLIINSKVQVGMTKDECRLALGNPTTRGEIPTTAGIVEYWAYSEGKYLLFEEGYLSSIR